MANETLKKAYGDYLNTLNIHVLRNVARFVGVYKPTDGKKQDLIDRTIAVLLGVVAPVAPSNRGAPLKEDLLDPRYVRELERIKKEYSVFAEIDENENVVQVRAEDEQTNAYDTPLYMGILEISANGGGFLRGENCAVTPKDVFVSAKNIAEWKLREGDYVVGYATRQENGNLCLMKTLSVNSVAHYEERGSFEKFSVGYPVDRIKLSESNDWLSLRMVDLFAPVGKGQRAIICTSPIADAGALFRDIAFSFEEKNNRGENYHLLALLIDERPEDITEYKNAVKFGETYYTTFNMDVHEHVRITNLVFARAKRLAEAGEDVVILFDSLTSFTYAANACCTASKTTLCGLGVESLVCARALLSAVGNFGSGSITVFATAFKNEGNNVDEFIRVEYEKLCNCCIYLDEELAKKHIFPTFSVKNSYTRRAESLLSAKELKCAKSLRCRFEKDVDIQSFMESYSDNEEMVKVVDTEKFSE